MLIALNRFFRFLDSPNLSDDTFLTLLVPYRLIEFAAAYLELFYA